MNLSSLLAHCNKIDECGDCSTYEVNAGNLLTYKEDILDNPYRVIELVTVSDETSQEEDPGIFVILNIVGEEDAVCLKAEDFDAYITVWTKR